MKKLLLSITIILISFLYFPGAVFAQAVIEIPDKDFNFGDALPGQVFHHTYVVKNSGNVDLIISEVTPSCGCTTALLVDKIVPPGKSVKIEADFTAPMNDGVVKKSINVLTNDPKSPTTIIYLNATVKSDFLIEPKKIDIGEMFIGEKKEFKFTIKPINKKPFEPTQIVFSKETFKVIVLIAMPTSFPQLDNKFDNCLGVKMPRSKNSFKSSRFSYNATITLPT